MNVRPAARPPLMPKPISAPWPLGMYLLRQLVRRVRRQAGIVDPLDFGVLAEVFGDAERVLAVAVQAQAERLDTLQEQERVERRQRRTEVAQQLHARLEDKRRRAKVGEAQAMVARIGRW